jgi:hypothetical protein
MRNGIADVSDALERPFILIVDKIERFRFRDYRG